MSFLHQNCGLESLARYMVSSANLLHRTWLLEVPVRKCSGSPQIFNYSRCLEIGKRPFYSYLNYYIKIIPKITTYVDFLESLVAFLQIKLIAVSNAPFVAVVFPVANHTLVGYFPSQVRFISKPFIHKLKGRSVSLDQTNRYEFIHW